MDITFGNLVFALISGFVVFLFVKTIVLLISYVFERIEQEAIARKGKIIREKMFYEEKKNTRAYLQSLEGEREQTEGLTPKDKAKRWIESL